MMAHNLSRMIGLVALFGAVFCISSPNSAIAGQFQMLPLLIVPALPTAPPTAATGDLTAEEGVPPISPRHRKFLSALARRTMQDAIDGKPLYEPSYVPRALAGVEAEVVIRLRSNGFLQNSGVGGPLPVAEATRNAAIAAVAPLIESGSLTDNVLSLALIEIEVVGPAEFIDIDVDWTEPRAVDPYIEPGIHGFVFLSKNIQRRFCPTEIFTSDMVVAQALEAVAQQLKAVKSQIPDMRLMRFRTAHWYQPKANAPIVSLHRGLTILPIESVTPENINKAVTSIAEYMAYRQQPSGLFSYQYEPAKDTYSTDNNFVRQAGAIASMCIHASMTGKSSSKIAADMGVRQLLGGLTDIKSQEGAAFIGTADGKHKLGVTALASIALAAHPDHEQYAKQRQKLINGMLWLQRSSGMFITAFPPARQVTAQEYFPGEALLAMAMDYRHRPSAEVLDAFDRAIGFYRVYFDQHPSPAFVPWQVQAYTEMAIATKREDYVEFVFELTDWLAEKQLTPENCDWPEMWGGIASYQPNRAGIATAAYLEGFTDALVLARRFGDEKRIARYERLVRLATRFVMQLQVRPEEAYFMRSPDDAVGGIRTTPSLNLLRIDHCQHAMIGLLKASNALYPDRDE